MRPVGDGPFGVVLERTPYNRKQQAAKVTAFLPSMKTGATGSSKVPGSEIPMFACFDSPGPLTTHPITATFISITPGYRSRHTGICSRRYV